MSAEIKGVSWQSDLRFCTNSVSPCESQQISWTVIDHSYFCYTVIKDI